MIGINYYGGVGMRSGQRVILRCKRRDSRKAAALLLNTTGTRSVLAHDYTAVILQSGRGVQIGLRADLYRLYMHVHTCMIDRSRTHMHD